LPARREALRGTFDPSYGSYTLGKLLIRTLCVGVERERGMAFSATEACPSPSCTRCPSLRDSGRLL